MSAKAKKSLAEQLADLDTTAPADLDPEQFDDTFQERGAEDEEGPVSDDDKNARDHYVDVGKSALRKSQFLLEDPKYGGKRSNRKSIFDDAGSEEISDTEEEEDAEDDEDDEDENVADSDDGDIEQQSDDEELESDEMNDDDEAEEDDESDQDEEAPPIENEAEVQEELKRLREEEKKMLSTMTKSAQADIEKGQHVKEQLTLWDGFLDTRIRMQKAMNIANQLPQFDVWPNFLMIDADVIPHVEATKSKLRTLIDSVMDIRVDLIRDNNDSIIIPKDAAQSRKRHLDDDDEYVDKLWDDMSQMNELFTSYRNATIEKWGNKVQIASGIPLNKKFKAFDQNIMTQVSSILGDNERLVKRTQLKRTEYQPLGKESPAKEDAKEASEVDGHLADHDSEIFDDNDFYQQLLKELIESRMVDTDDPIALGMRWAALKQNKQKKKTVDTRASKGRRLRYHVHEKIQNFMVPVPTGSWHEEMIDELYASLLGRKQRDLITEEEEAEEEKDGDAEDHEIVNGQAVDGLRIFG
ncbi:rRNA-processing protein bfr2 [Umbelopsis nana]